jgi:hypothetical protein
MAEGIEVRTSKDGRKSYRASVWSARDSKLIRKTSRQAVPLSLPMAASRNDETAP